jgi:5-methylcytosine-specific restriction endonuclease McrA
MYKNSKYTSLYFRLIQVYSTTKSKLTESHHIVPRSCGGQTVSENLVNIPSRVHFILHKLLPKMIDDSKLQHKMRYALWRMMNPQFRGHNRTYVVTSFDYVKQREFVRNRMIGDNNPMRRPEVVEKFRRKRPEQSAVASKRNVEYWATRKHPILQLKCGTCKSTFETSNAKRRFCCKSCSASHNNKMRPFGNKVGLKPHSV